MLRRFRSLSQRIKMRVLRSNRMICETPKLSMAVMLKPSGRPSLLRNCLRKIPAISFYRFGLITGDTVSGATSKSDFLALFIRGISAIGCVPPIAEELSVDITPIDFAARAFATIAVDEQCRGAFGTYHIANPVSLPLSQLIKVVEGCGIPLATVAAEEFEQQYKQLASSSIVNAKSASAAARLALCRCLSGRSDISVVPHARLISSYEPEVRYAQS